MFPKEYPYTSSTTKILRDNFGNNLQDKGSYASSLITNQEEIDNTKEHNRPLDEKIQSLTKKRDALVDKACKTNDDKKMESRGIR